MKVYIHLKQDPGMSGTYTHYDMQITDTIYQDRQKYNELNMQWSAFNRTWSKSGSISRDIPTTKQILLDKLTKKLGNYQLEVTR